MLRRMRDSHTGLLAARCFSWELVVFYSVVSNFMEIGTVVCAPCLIVLWSFTSFSLVSFCLRICWTENKSLTRNRFPGKTIAIRFGCVALAVSCFWCISIELAQWTAHFADSATTHRSLTHFRNCSFWTLHPTITQRVMFGRRISLHVQGMKTLTSIVHRYTT